ncbi:MAG: family 43 glycosylhydrolase [Bacteroidota bacterium]
MLKFLPWKGLLTAGFLISLLAVSHVLPAQTFTNPLRWIPDPFITCYKGVYYLTGTTSTSVCLAKSSTLEGLKTAQMVSVFRPGKDDPCCNYWANEIFRIQNKWYIYYTAGTQTDWAHQNTYVLENSSEDPLTGKWLNKGKLYDPTADFWAIDGTILENNGNHYFLWSGHKSPTDNNQQIYISAMANPWTLTGHRAMLSEPQYEWEKIGDPKVNEGPEILQHKGKTFLIYSASGCWTPDYSLGMLTLDPKKNPMEPASWIKSAMPVFKRNDAVAAYGPGHNCFFQSPDGKETWNIYHATSNSAGGCDDFRNARAQKVNWNADGTPDFGTPVKLGEVMKAPSGEKKGASTLATVATTPPLPNGVYRITAKHSGKVIQATECAGKPGSILVQGTWNGQDCQKWNLEANEDGFYGFNSIQDKLVYDVTGCSVDDGVNILLWHSVKGPWQQWKIEPAGDGYFKMTGRKSVKALEVGQCSLEEKAHIQQDAWSGEDCQLWKIERVD